MQHYDKARSYYAGLLDGLDTDCLPVYDMEQSGSEIGHLTVQTVPDIGCLAETVKDGGVTLNGLWNAAFGFALSKFLYREDSIFLKEACAIFPNTTLATDGLVCPVNYSNSPALP